MNFATKTPRHKETPRTYFYKLSDPLYLSVFVAGWNNPTNYLKKQTIKT